MPPGLPADQLRPGREAQEENPMVMNLPLLPGLPPWMGWAHSHTSSVCFPVWVNPSEIWGFVYSFLPHWVVLLVSNLAKPPEINP